MHKKTRHSLICNLRHGHPHEQGSRDQANDHSSQDQAQGVWGHLAIAFHLPGHGHAHAAPGLRDPMLTNRLGTRALVWSLLLLFATTVIQFIIYAASGSVALLADTVHNLGDALNSVPLLIAFWLARRPATQRYTYGYARAEDLGGLLVVVSILFSAGFILWQVAQKFIDPAPIQNSGWVILAALIGFLGNEAVALLEIRVGTQIGSEAMKVDGRHARLDGLTSLAVLPAVAGSLLGLPILDPIFGVLIGVAILFITRDATLSIWYRLMDAVDPGSVKRAKEIIQRKPAIKAIRTLRMRWMGHNLWIEGKLEVDPSMTAGQIEELQHELGHELQEHIPNLGETTLAISSNEHSRIGAAMKQPSEHQQAHSLETEGNVIHWAGLYDLMVNRVFGRLSRRLRLGALQQAGIKPGASILDFGCGAGDLAFEAERLTEGASQIVGIDPSPEMVKVARQKAAKRTSKVQFQVEAAEKLSFPAGTFDAVISSFVLHHLPENLQNDAFRELKRVLKPGGLFFAIDMKPSRTIVIRLHGHLQDGEDAPGNGLKRAAARLTALGFTNVEVGNTPSKSIGFVRGISA